MTLMRLVLAGALVVSALLFNGCADDVLLDIPEFRYGGLLSQTKPLPEGALNKLEGVWHLQAGRDRFGDSVVIKVSGDRLTIFARPNVSYLVLEAGYLDSVVFLEGYWREQVTANTWLVRLVIPKESGGDWLVSDGERPATLSILGGYGSGSNGNPDTDLAFTWARPFSDKARTPFAVIAHRGGGRTADRIPASENTLELLRIAERYGSNAVEIDVRLSSDGVPYLYHDGEINPRLVRRGALVGPTENYPYAVLRQYATLINGEHIPTLEEALDVIATETTLQFVYLDTKTEEAGLIARMVPLMAAAKAKADAVPGRPPLVMLIVMPTQAVYDEFMQLPNPQSIPSLCELSVEQTRAAGSAVWAPRWTLGTQNEQVLQVQSEGIATVTWTLDIDEFVESFIRDGHFNGILTNYPTLVTYHRLMR